MKRTNLIAGGVYFAIMITSVVVTLSFGLIPLTQMGIRADTLPMGIVAGVICQIPMLILAYTGRRSLEPGSDREKLMTKLMRHARMHATYAFFDAPVAESFWSGIVLSSLVAYLAYLGLGALYASVLGLLIGTAIHIVSHLGPLRPLFGEGAPLAQTYFVMLLNRIAFIATNNLIAPILGHFLFANYILVGWRLGKKS
jgi:hypothetical protein